jgi:mono/diheme cytochrome c family protein
VTEVPEHLLRRSQERRAAMGMGPEPGDAGAGAGAAAPAESAASSTEVEAAAPAAAPAPVAAAPDVPPPPPPPYIQAAERRKRIPIWALPVLGLLPVWALLYATTLDPKTSAASDPVAAGAAIFTERCASCHGATGGGGVGPQLSDGLVIETFAEPADQAEWVALGSEGFLAEGVYGDAGKPVGGGMPAFGGTLTPEELTAVIAHERVTLSGEEYDPLVYEELLLSLEEGG